MPQGEASVLMGGVFVRPCGRLGCAFRVADPLSWEGAIGDGRLVANLEMIAGEGGAPGGEIMTFVVESSQGDTKKLFLGRTDTILPRAMAVNRILGTQGVLDVFLVGWSGTLRLGKTEVKMVHFLAALEDTPWDQPIHQMFEEMEPPNPGLLVGGMENVQEVPLEEQGPI